MSKKKFFLDQKNGYKTTGILTTALTPALTRAMDAFPTQPSMITCNTKKIKEVSVFNSPGCGRRYLPHSADEKRDRRD